MVLNYSTTSETVNLTNCDREPIHIPGSIQPHGMLFVLTEPTLEIVQVSANSEQFLNIPPQKLIGKSIQDWLSADQIKALHHCLAEDFESVNPLKVKFHHLIDQQFNGIVHRSDQFVILEIEPTTGQEPFSFFDFHDSVKAPLNKIQKAKTLTELCQVIVAEIQRITEFDRVMVYRFNAEGSGTVIAEKKRQNLTPFLGLKYPASDIPQPARKLYLLNLLRIIPDINYEPVTLTPMNNALSDEPLDLSLSILRSVSPIHIEYLTNMKVSASMSISLIQDQQLWGLIACHHNTPKCISYETRTICEFLAQVMANELTHKEANENLDEQMNLRSIQSQFVESIIQKQNLIEALSDHEKSFLDLVNAQGAALYLDEQLTLMGKTPTKQETLQLIDWIGTQINPEEVIYHTNSLTQSYSPTHAFQMKDVASGVLAIAISKVQKNYLLWFRPEFVQTVSWGGNPNKPVEKAEDGIIYLSPRQSFERWKETVHLKSLPWTRTDINAALELRNNIIGIVLRKAEELAEINQELERSNHELDAFAYVASHDLKEPLRGIHNYSSFLLEDYVEILDEEGVSKLQTIARLTQRMEDLINSLLHFSRLGRAELLLRETDLNDSLKQVIETVKINFNQSSIQVKIPRPLPRIKCDRVQLSEVFSNLVTNGIKYNNNPEKIIEIGWYETPQTEKHLPSDLFATFYTFYVKDNGIGIRQRHLETVFQIFKRLHSPKKYGGGTGAGLTITKKIVERHKGQIWLESTYGEGSTFYFTIPS